MTTKKGKNGKKSYLDQYSDAGMKKIYEKIHCPPKDEDCWAVREFIINNCPPDHDVSDYDFAVESCEESIRWLIKKRYLKPPSFYMK